VRGLLLANLAALSSTVTVPAVCGVAAMLGASLLFAQWSPATTGQQCKRARGFELVQWGCIAAVFVGGFCPPLIVWRAVTAVEAFNTLRRAARNDDDVWQASQSLSWHAINWFLAAVV
jgi:hypothetical protein